MDVLKFINKKVILSFSKEELCVICNAINEVCNGIEVWEFETRMAISAEGAQLILDKLLSVYNNDQLADHNLMD